jgi:molybdopterin/thiamine biosynthesis adenylyltransferase
MASRITSKKAPQVGEQARLLFRPEILDLSNADHENRFSSILDMPGLTVHDQIMGQITEWIKTKHPGRRLSADEAAVLAKKHIGSQDLVRYGVWVFYPWSLRLVHILNEEAFTEVRTSRNQYKITKEEREVLSRKKVGVIGLSVGQSVSVTMAMERIFGEIRLADFDLLELTNLNRIRTGLHNLGLPKVYSVAREIAEIDPFLRVICFPDGLTEQNMDSFFLDGGKLDLLVEESDGFDIKILCRYKAKALKVPVIMEASDRCMVDVERFDLEPDRPVLHGIVKKLDIPTLKSLKTNEEKIPYMLDVLGIETTTPRLRASMLEMQQTISTWPQLASAVTMGGGITADVSRRILLNHFRGSGRYYVDVDELIGDGSTHIPLKKVLKKTVHEKWKVPAKISLKVEKVSRENLHRMITAAGMALSPGNTQPWHWLYKSDILHLFVDAASALQFSDHNFTQTIVSCGSAAENLLLKARELGYETETVYHKPSKGFPLLSFAFRKSKGKIREPLARYISADFMVPGSKDEPVSPTALAEMKGIVDNLQDISLQLLSAHGAIAYFASLEALCSKIRILTPALHEEFFSRILVPGSEEGNTPLQEGIPSAFETAFHLVSDRRVASLLREWHKGEAFSSLVYSSLVAASAIGMIRVKDGNPRQLIEAGRAAQRIHLIAAKNNLSIRSHYISLALLDRFRDKKESVLFTEQALGELGKAQQDWQKWVSGKDTIAYLFSIKGSEKKRVPGRRKSIHAVLSAS